VLRAQRSNGPAAVLGHQVGREQLPARDRLATVQHRASELRLEVHRLMPLVLPGGFDEIEHLRALRGVKTA
jgi:hypothetical protein